MKKNLQYAIKLLLFWFIVACAPNLSEIRRTSNTNASIEAIEAIRETGATVATPTEIYVVPKGMKIEGNPILRADNVEGLVLTWDDEVSLRIHAEKARVFLKSEDMKILVAGKPVTVRIRFEIKELH